MESHSPDWRIWLGLTLTLSWLGLGAAHIAQEIGWNNFSKLPAAELGSFLEGAFAPLAFLWLVIGYFLQQKELQQNTQALTAQANEIQRTAEQAVIQSQKMAESEVHARQEAFLQISHIVRRQLGLIIGFLYISSQSSQADGTVTSEEQSKLFTASGQDPEVFPRRMLELHIQLTGQQETQYRLFYGTQIRARHSNNFISTFERLMARAEAVESDNLIRDALLTSGIGFVYTIAKHHQAAAPPELVKQDKTGLFIAT
jgi:hypothetical protein